MEIQRTQSIDWLIWIELIPFKETRNYVQRVMENYIVYQHRIQCFKRKPDDLEYILNNALSPLYSSFENHIEFYSFQARKHTVKYHHSSRPCGAFKCKDHGSFQAPRQRIIITLTKKKHGFVKTYTAIQ